jgi:chorismate mutase
MTNLNLDTIAATLEGLEETIIYRLIDRAQFKTNDRVYMPGQSGFSNGNDDKSLFELRLQYHEEIDARFGRFCVPEERPFCKDLPSKQREVKIPDPGLHISNYDLVNLTQQIKQMYVDFIPKFCLPGNDLQYGSSVEIDVYALQAICRRIHYGALYVAECKYRNNPDAYKKLIAKEDRGGILELLTRKEIEMKIIERVKSKVAHVQSGVNLKVRRVIDPDVILTFYNEHIIPLTKEGEVLYLLKRDRD